MKKTVAIILAALLALSLAGCGKTEAAAAADEAIAAIGEVTLDSLAVIEAAEDAVDDLTEEEKGQLDNLAVLEEARAAYDQLVLEDKAAAIDVLIDDIGTVTLESSVDISAARASYDSADPEVQALVTGLADLEAAESEYAELCAGEVEEKIDAIGDVTLENVGAVHDARAAFDALSAEQQELVSNSGKLMAAETAVKELAQQLLSGMRLEEDVVRGMRFYNPSAWKYYSNGSWVADQRSFVLPYLGQDDTRTWIRLVFNYTGYDWVFFDSLLISIDGELYTKAFNYFDITRDNSGGRVWEYIDVDGTSDDYIDLMWAIAESEQTIIRFQGDDYSSDLTVTDTDKNAIREVLLCYEALS